MKTGFSFFRPGKLVDGELVLCLKGTHVADPVKKYSPSYEFEMRHGSSSRLMGIIRLRIGPARQLRYPGHIGYEVKPHFRGHRYAVRSCRLLLPLALAHGLSAVWLTVDPRNVASVKTCDILGAKCIETVRIPRAHEMYRHGARFRRRYRIDVRKALSRGKPR